MMFFLSNRFILTGCLGLAMISSSWAETKTTFPSVNPEFVPKIEAALPTAAPAKPKSPRKILLFSRTEGFEHKSIPTGIYTFTKLGEKTGAFSVVESGDMEIFAPEKLKEFDAILFNNTTQLKFENPAHRQAFLEFVRIGKGVIGIHSATDNFPTFPEGQACIGGKFDGHPWGGGETEAIKLDEPGHVLNKGFQGRGFWIKDEIYQMGAPYSREKQRVLVSLDMSKPQNQRPVDRIKRTDNDFAISWIRMEGKGRVFYSSFGHNDEIYWNPEILQHWLAGIQFALGDLEADATPQTKPGNPALAPEPVLTSSQDDSAKWCRSPEAIAFLKSYVAGQDDANYVKFRNGARLLIPSERNALESEIIKAGTAGELSASGRTAAIRFLIGFGTDAGVPLLSKWVKDEDGFEALEALANIHSAASQKALVEIFGSASDSLKVSILNALAAANDAALVGKVSNLLGSPVTGPAALNYLGAIGSDAAISTLNSFKAPDGLKGARAVALIGAARHAAVQDRKDKARIVLEGLLKLDQSMAVRTGAAETLLTVQGAGAVTALLPYLKANEGSFSVVLAKVLVAYPKGNLATETAKAIAENFAGLPEPVQSALLSNINNLARQEYLPVVEQGLGVAADSVKILALVALGKVGEGEPAFKILSAALGIENQKETAIRALARLKGPASDSLSRAAAKAADPKQKIVWLGVLSQRADVESFPLFVEAAHSEDPALKGAAFGGLADVARPQDLDRIIELRKDAVADPEIKKWREALIQLSKSRGGDKTAVVLLGDFAGKATPEDQPFVAAGAAWVDVPESADLIKTMLGSPDLDRRKAIIRSLSGVRTVLVAGLLEDAATNGKDDSEKILALRGLLDGVREIQISDGEKIKMYGEIWNLAFRAEEKDAVVASLKNMKKKEADDLVAKLSVTAPSTN